MQVYRCLSSIQALCFDLDDTLYDNHSVMRKLENEMEKWLHTYHPISAQFSSNKWKKFKQDLVEKTPELKHDVTLWRHMQIEQGLKWLGYDDTQAKQAAEDGIKHALWLRNKVNVPAISHQVLEALSKKFPLVAITNGNVDVKKIGLDSYFNLVLKSGPCGRSKPYPDMFIAAAKFLKLPHNKILHIGDNPVSDISGAKRSGYSACWLNTSGKPVNKEPKMQSLPDIEISNIEELLILL